MGHSHIEVSGTGSASATPDVVQVRVRVLCDGDTVAAALADAGGRAAALAQAARDRGVPDAGLRTAATGCTRGTTVRAPGWWATRRPRAGALPGARGRLRGCPRQGRTVCRVGRPPPRRRHQSGRPRGRGCQPSYQPMAASTAAVGVEPGEATVTATVVVRWEWD